MLGNLVAQVTSDYYYTTTTSDAVPTGMVTALMLILWIPVLIISIVVIISMWKVFAKAGKPGWAAIVPIYNEWVLFEIVGYPGWWALLSFVPFVNIFPAVMMMVSYYKIAKLFGKSDGFAICNIFFPFVTMPILGFGQSQFMGSPAPAGFGAAQNAPYVPVPTAPYPVAPLGPEQVANPVVASQPSQPSQPTENTDAPQEPSQPQTPSQQPPLVQ